ncbi:MAG: hypothetical protein JWO02_3414 [Solirubrobacterales bacterium]|nr:hypothetical protein [Solirubrobacterales bacterium]
MKKLALIEPDKSAYADRFWTILEETGLEPQEFEALDYFSYLPFFVLAGASVETHLHTHGDHFHFEGVTLSIPEELEEAFYAVLPQILEQLQAEED